MNTGDVRHPTIAPHAKPLTKPLAPSPTTAEINSDQPHYQNWGLYPKVSSVRSRI
ncbi:unnamed protein product, partial [Dibothriocephalus latus]